jgi:hypothetical protein
MMEELEIFFSPLTTHLNDLINPIIKEEEEPQFQIVGGKQVPIKKEEKKAVP